MKIKNALFLLLAAAIWGSTFVAQSAGMDYVGPFTYLCARSFLGVLVLLPCIAVLNRVGPAEGRAQPGGRRWLLIGGLSCGVVLFLASASQQIGIVTTSAGKTGFLTACYILLVPVFGLFLGKKCRAQVWIAVVIAVIGLYFLCLSNGFTLERGDAFGLLCAVLYAAHILVIDHFNPHVDGVKLSCLQFLVVGILSGVFMLALETPQLSQVLAAWKTIAYAGILSSGVAYTLQILGQKDMNPTVASLIMSLESVIAAVTGYFVLGERLTLRELLGCALMFAAILLSQLPGRAPKKTAQETDGF